MRDSVRYGIRSPGKAEGRTRVRYAYLGYVATQDGLSLRRYTSTEQTSVSQMEFSQFVRKYRLTQTSKIILSFWVVFFIVGGLLSIPAFSSFESVPVDILMVSLGLLMLAAAVLVSCIATYGAMKLLPREDMGSLLFKLWIVPFFGTVYYLAMRFPNSRLASTS